jgi:hypothetical protein
VVRRSETGVLAVEIAWLRAAELPKLSRVEELLAGTGPGAAAAQSSPPRTAAAPRATEPRQERAPAPPARAAAPASTPKPAPPAPTAQTAQPAPPTPPRPEPPPAARPAPPAGDPLQAFLEAVSLRRAPFAALLSEAELALVDGELRIAVPAEDILDARLQQPAYRQMVDEAVAATWGPGFPWRTVRGALRAKPVPAGPAEAPAADRARSAENPQVQAVLDIFGGRVETVEEHGGFREEQP